ncbi:hypothetical protein SNE40_008732 [Patella caerulea]|uniref:Uncharacterized protein n=1 Tax=Patella caerulea TaxID=87958 RepID=A0AAN8PP02_PATCE
MMFKLLICCVFVAAFKQNFVDGLNSNLKIASELRAMKQLARDDVRDQGQKKLSEDKIPMLKDRLASKKNKYGEDEIGAEVEKMADNSRDALHKLPHVVPNRQGDKLGEVVKARYRIKRSVEAQAQGGGNGGGYGVAGRGFMKGHRGHRVHHWGQS